MSRRIARIYPGFLVAFTVSLIVGICASGSAWLKYVSYLYYSNDVLLQAFIFLRYGALNSEFVFTDNPFPHAVNASLWTLHWELLCYLVVLFLGVLKAFKHPNLILGLFLLSWLSYWVNYSFLSGSDGKFIRFLAFFACGSASACGLFGQLQFTKLRSAISLLAVATMVYWDATCALLYLPVTAYVLFGIAFSSLRPKSVFFSQIDLSYGIYLYAFPVQQISVALLDLRSPMQLFFVATMPTCLFAWLSWRFVEKPAMQFVRNREANEPLRPSPPNVRRWSIRYQSMHSDSLSKICNLTERLWTLLIIRLSSSVPARPSSSP